MKIPQEVSAYFEAGRRRIVSAVPNTDDYTLLLTFDNGEQRIFDVKPFIQGGRIGALLKDKERFSRVRVDGSVVWDIDPTIDSSEVWENVIDLCPDSCYMKSVPV